MSDSSPLWFFGQGGQQHGPVSTDALRQMLREGRISSADLVWREGMSEWRVVAGLPEFANPGAAPLAPTPQAMAPPGQYGARPLPAQYGAQPAQYGVQYGGYRPPTSGSYYGLAVAGFVLSFIIPLAGLIISLVALSNMKRSGDSEGRGLAKAGLIISIAWFVVGFLFFCLWSTLIVGVIGASHGH